MDETELFTVNVFQTSDKQENDANEVDQKDQLKSIGEFQNMVSARVIKVSIWTGMSAFRNCECVR
jgi:isopentenyldiphosphate isomerase